MTVGRHRSALALATAVLTAATLGACSRQDVVGLPEGTGIDVPDIRGADDVGDLYTGALNEHVRDQLPAWPGQELTVLAEVAEVVSPRAFTVTSPEGVERIDPVLVVATDDAGADAAAGEQLVLAVTPVEGFLADVVVDEFGLDADPGALAEWEGSTFLVATVVEPAG